MECNARAPVVVWQCCEETPVLGPPSVCEGVRVGAISLGSTSPLDE